MLTPGSYDPHKPRNKDRFHVSLLEYENTQEIITFARNRDQGVSVIEILRGAPKVHDGVSKAFSKPTVMNFQLYVRLDLFRQGCHDRDSQPTRSGLDTTWFVSRPRSARTLHDYILPNFCVSPS